MKTCPSALAAHLAQDTTTVAVLCKLTRTDGTVLGFTTHDVDLSFGGVDYLAANGFTSSALASHSDLAVDNREVTGFLESDSITEGDIRACKYDNVDIEIRLVNWAESPLVHAVIVQKGTIGRVKMVNGVFTAEIRSLAAKLTAQIGSTYGPICRATFGSGLNGIDMTSRYLCMFDVTTVRQTGSVASVIDERALIPDRMTNPPGYTPPPTLSAVAPATAAQSHRQNDWANPDNAKGISAYATATLYGSNDTVNESSLLQFTNFGLAIPSNATVVGIQFSVTRRQTAGTSAVYDDTVTLLGGGGTSGDRSDPSPWPPNPAAATYGGPSDLWGLALTPAIVNSPTFGLQFGCECTLSPGTGADISLNGVTLTVFYTGVAIGPPPGWFNDGFLTFTSGELSGASFEVKSWDGTTLEFFLAMPATPVPGDTFTIEPGCDKTTQTCQGKFQNIVNFRGEPFIPGMDQLLDYAT